MNCSLVCSDSLFLLHFIKSFLLDGFIPELEVEEGKILVSFLV